MRLAETRANQNKNTPFLSSSSLSTHISVPRGKKTKKSPLTLDVEHNPNCTLRIKVCRLPARWNKPSTRKEIKILNFSALPYRGEMLLQKLCQRSDLPLSCAVFQASSPDNSISSIWTTKVI